MSQTEAVSSLVLKLGPVVKDVILPALVASFTRKGIKQYLHDTSEEIILALMNHCEITCHVCMKYMGWNKNLAYIQELQENQKNIGE